MSLQKLKSLSVFQQRKAAAILGGLVADAAIAPLHWIYDQGKMADLIKAEGHAEFYPTSQCPYYTIPTGNNSTFGDELYVTLKHIAENKGFDGEKLGDALFQFFGPGTVYEQARTQSGTPVKGPWTNHCLKIMIANRENEVTPAGDRKSQDPDGFCMAVALAGILGDTENAMDGQVRECVEITMLNHVAADFAVAGFGILEGVIRTGQVDFDKAIHDKTPDVVKDAIKSAKACDDPHVPTAKNWGLICAYPASFAVGLHGVKCAGGYVERVREEAMAAGDNCSRVVLVASICAARDGLDSIPEEWLKKYSRSEEVLGYIETIVQL